MPIKRRYHLERLREQLDNATSGGTVNIFKVATKNGIRLPEADLDDDGDAPGETDFPMGGMGGSRRQSSVSFMGQTPQRRPSQASRA